MIVSDYTVDAGVKSVTLLQRACDAENQVKNELSNGPQRAPSNVEAEYSATWGHTLVVGDMLVSLKVHGYFSVNSRWHRG